MLVTPVAFFIFNRPETTEAVFAAIAQARPTKLLVVADGPRPERPGEAERCKAARAVIERIDWDCEVLTNFAETNMGCKRRISSGLDWVFEQVEEAIILEDDCLPHPSFFAYCQDLLERYRHDERIGYVSGQNLGFGPSDLPHDYVFSHCAGIWGWATWRRAWLRYDRNLATWPLFRDAGCLASILRHPAAIRYWQGLLDATHRGEIDTWDYQWLYSNWSHGALGIIPRHNLISNLGFGPGATHTRDVTSKQANMPSAALPLPLTHPPFVLRHPAVDAAIERYDYILPPLPVRAFRKGWRHLMRLLPASPSSERAPSPVGAQSALTAAARSGNGPA